MIANKHFQLIKDSCETISLVDDEIIVIKNFSRPQFNGAITDIANCLTEESWLRNDNSNGTSTGYIWHGRNFISAMTNEFIKNNIMIHANAFFSDLDLRGLAMLQRMLPGQSLDSHTDNATGDVVYGIIAYFNDEYKGGELFYEDYDITYKPKSGDLVVHGSEVKHQVLPVTEGKRYFTTGFVFTKSNN